MSEPVRRILLIVGFVVVVLALGFGLYWVFFRAAPVANVPVANIPGAPGGTLPTPGAGVGQPGGPPSTTTGGLPTPGGIIPTPVPPLPTGLPQAPRTEVVTQTPTQMVSMSSNGNLRGYNPTDGKFYTYSADGVATPLSNQTFYNVQSVAWAGASNKAILSYPDGSNIYYDFATDKQVTLPRHWDGFAFSPQDDKIVTKSVGNNEDNRFLVVANPDGSSAKPIESLGNNQDLVQVNWSPNNQVIAFSQTGDALGMDRQEILMVGQNHENFKGLVVEGRGFDPSWSPSGKNLLYSVYSSADNYNPTLWISGAEGDSVNANRTNLQLATWADKCAWANETQLICGVPTTLPQGSGLQPDLAQNIPDEIYKVDLTTGTKVNLGLPAGNASVKQMTITPDGKTALFTDATTGRLVRFDLQ
jgi:Tol biopolymer transport system component